MKRRVFKNKKGFTLVELIVTIAIMAILAAAVTPAVYVTTKRRQKSAAETDTQTMYRNAIAAVTYLSGQYIYPNKPDPRKEDVDNGVHGWYVTYSAMVCKRIYQTVIGLDIPVKYYNPDASGTEKVLVPDGCNAVERSSFVSADNKILISSFRLWALRRTTTPTPTPNIISSSVTTTTRISLRLGTADKRFQRLRMTTSRKIRRQIRNLTAPIRPTKTLPSAIRSK